MKNWIVAFATEKFYLTEDEANFYMQELAKGTKFVYLKSGLMLSDKALYVIPSKKFEEADLIEAGKPKKIMDFNTETGKYYVKNQKEIDEWSKAQNGVLELES